MTSAGASAAGPAGGIKNALANAPEAAMQGLDRARSMVQDAIRTVMQNTDHVIDGLGSFGRDMAGQATGAIAPDLVGHLPEVVL